ncbi:hypothetical protein BsWGS_00444 [Bradybaena similaris]
MVYLELSLAVAVSFMALVTFDCNAVSPSQQESCRITPTTVDQDLEPAPKSFDAEDIPPFTLPECNEPPYAIKNGRIVPLFYVKYTLTCDATHTVPLGSTGKWSCKSAKTVNNSEAEIFEDDLKVSECNEIHLPQTIYIEREVHVHKARNCNYGEKAYMSQFGELLHTKKTFLVQGLDFYLQFVPELTKCSIMISNISYVFQEWVAYLKFRLVHKPKYKNVNKAMLTEGNCLLEAAIREIMTENLKTNKDASFDLEKPDLLFHAGPCADAGQTIEKEYQNGFDGDVPICKMCMRGFYLDTKLGSCVACEPNSYASEAGQTKCISCPTVHAKYKSRKSDSIMDCYAWVTHNNWKAVGRGLVFIVTFHLVYVAILTWNIRRYIQVNLIRRRRSEEDTPPFN